jgi:hypothetical protein
MNSELRLIYTRTLKRKLPMRLYRSRLDPNCYRVKWRLKHLLLGDFIAVCLCPVGMTQSECATSNMEHWERV